MIRANRAGRDQERIAMERLMEQYPKTGRNLRGFVSLVRGLLFVMAVLTGAVIIIFL